MLPCIPNAKATTQEVGSKARDMKGGAWTDTDDQEITQARQPSIFPDCQAHNQ